MVEEFPVLSVRDRAAPGGVNPRRRLAFVTTVTEDSDMASPAITGDNSMPVKG